MRTPGRLLNRALADALDRVSRLDAGGQKGLRKLEGRAMGVELLGPGLRLVLGVDEGRIVALDPDEYEIDTWIRSSPGSLFSLAASGGRAASGQVEVSGDAETARRFQEFFRRLSPDWEEGLTRLLGDRLGVQLARLLRGGGAWLQRSGEGFSRDLSAYLREESRQLVTRREMDDFLDAVDDLRDDAARLEARFRRLSGDPG